MPRVSDISYLYQREQHTLIVRSTVNVSELPQLIGEAYHQITKYLSDVALLPAGIPFVCYHNMDLEHLEVEIGFPVEANLAGQQEIQEGLIPGSRIVTAIHRGPYSEMNTTYDEMASWMEEHQLTPAGPVYEYYLNGPEFPPEELLTRIVFPIR